MLGARRFACRYFGICLRARRDRALLACLYLLRSELPAARARAAASHTARTRAAARARARSLPSYRRGVAAHAQGHEPPCSRSALWHTNGTFSCGGGPSSLAGRFFSSSSAHFAMPERARAYARTDDDERLDVRFAGVVGWNTALGGGHGANAHRLGAPLLTRPLSPCPCKAAVPKGPVLLFLKLHPRK